MSGRPLLVELLLSNARIQGSTSLVEERRRLVDVLNSAEDAFRLDEVKVAMGSSPDGREFPSLSVEKRSIFVAIPRETDEQVRQRAMLRAFGGRSPTLPAAVTLLLPPFIVEGTAHISHGIGRIRGDLHADPEIFSRFIPMTDATVILPNGTSLEAPVLLVNRDLVAATSVVKEERSFAGTF